MDPTIIVNTEEVKEVIDSEEKNCQCCEEKRTSTKQMYPSPLRFMNHNKHMSAKLKSKSASTTTASTTGCQGGSNCANNNGTKNGKSVIVLDGENALEEIEVAANNDDCRYIYLVPILQPLYVVPPNYPPTSTMEPSMVKQEEKTPPSNGMNGGVSPRMSVEDGEKVYVCEYCNKTFTRSWNYQRHILIHSGRKPHKCEICSKAFVLAAHLKIHMRIHTGEKPYKCEVCGRGFAQLTNLQRHVLTHTGQKPHRCQHCNKGFVSSSDLRRHIRIHTGEKPYQCHACAKAFTTSGNLQSHVLTHTGVKPYSCSICKWKFISSSNLRTHIRTHHCQDETSDQMVPDNLVNGQATNNVTEDVFIEGVTVKSS